MTRAEMIQAWADLQSAHSTIMSNETIGQTTNGTDIYLYRIGDSTKGRFFISAGTHGFEKGGVEILYQFIDWVLNSDTDEANRILTNNYLIVVPILDIDGYPSISGMTMNSVNLWRNNYFRWGLEMASHTKNDDWTVWTQYCGPSAESEPETIAMRDAWREYDAALYIDIHVGGTGFAVGYSWMMDATDKAKAIAIGEKYVDDYTGTGLGIYAWGENAGSSGCSVSAVYNYTYTNSTKTIGFYVEATTQNPTWSTIATTHMPNVRAVLRTMAADCETLALNRTFDYQIDVPYTEWIGGTSGRQTHGVFPPSYEWLLLINFTGMHFNTTSSDPRFVVIVCNTTTYADQYVGVIVRATNIQVWEKVGSSQQQIGSTYTYSFSNSTVFVFAMDSGGYLSLGFENAQQEILNATLMPLGAMNATSIGVISGAAWSNDAGTVHLWYSSLLGIQYPEEGYITDSWRSYTNLTDTFKVLCDNYTTTPFYASYQAIGPSENSESIWSFTFGNGTIKLLIVAALHGDEHENSQMLYNFAYWLCASQSPQATAILTRLNITIVPVVNVDNFQATRKNINGVDLNRNFESGWDTAGSTTPTDWDYRGPSAASEAETIALEDFINVTAPDVFIDFHQFNNLFYAYNSAEQITARNTLWDAANVHWSEDSITSIPKTTSNADGYAFRYSILVAGAQLGTLVETGVTPGNYTEYSFGGTIWTKCKDIILAVSDVYGGEQYVAPLSVSLTSPVDLATSSTFSVSFSFVPTVHGDLLYHAELWLNLSGIYQIAAYNSSTLNNASANVIAYTFPSNNTYLWNIKIWNSTTGVSASSNRILTIAVFVAEINLYQITVIDKDLDLDNVDSYCTQQFLNGSAVLGYVEGSYTLLAGTVTVKTYYLDLLLNSTDFDMVTYGNSTVTIYLNMKALATGGFLAVNKTATISILNQTSTLINATITASGGFTVVSAVPFNASLVQLGGVNVTDWFFNATNLSLRANLTSGDFSLVFPQTLGDPWFGVTVGLVSIGSVAGAIWYYRRLTKKQSKEVS